MVSQLNQFKETLYANIPKLKSSSRIHSHDLNSFGRGSVTILLLLIAHYPPPVVVELVNVLNCFHIWFIFTFKYGCYLVGDCVIEYYQWVAHFILNQTTNCKKICKCLLKVAKNRPTLSHSVRFYSLRFVAIWKSGMSETNNLNSVQLRVWSF